jgi:stage II sporulation protein D
VPIAKLPALLNRPVRVLLHKQAGGMTLELHGDFGLAKLEGSQAIPQAQVVRGKTVVKLKGRDLEIIDASGPRILRHAAGLRLNPARMGSYFSLKGIPYRGSLELLIESASIQCLAVNVLPMDEYLRGVLPYELGRVDATMREALNGLAVVARTYALKRMLRPAAPRFDLYDDVQDQVYKGMKDEYALSDAAVRDTKGQVLLHADTLVQSYYHSTCAGKTASRHEVWDGAAQPYLISRDDVNPQGRPYCEASPMMSWQQSWSHDDFVSVLRRNYAAGRAEGPKEFRNVKAFEKGDTYRCGRLKSLRIVTDEGSIVLRGDRIRWALKPMRTDGRILESSRFDISLKEGRITATGSGFGHGVGLCQYGAMGRAKAGQNYREILSAYFAGTRVVEYR